MTSVRERKVIIMKITIFVRNSPKRWNGGDNYEKTEKQTIINGAEYSYL